MLRGSYFSFSLILVTLSKFLILLFFWKLVRLKRDNIFNSSLIFNKDTYFWCFNAITCGVDSYGTVTGPYNGFNSFNFEYIGSDSTCEICKVK